MLFIYLLSKCNKFIQMDVMDVTYLRPVVTNSRSRIQPGDTGLLSQMYHGPHEPV